jgi:glyoxylase-like metal-dependent hydrolase (beta-lactamase superfamily II)
MLEEESVLFTGDVVLGAGTTVIPRDGDLGDYMNSLELILRQEMSAIFPAHGPAIRNPHAKVREYIAHRQLRDRQIAQQLAAGVETAAALVVAIYVDIPDFLHPAAQVSVEAHLRRMHKAGRVTRDGERWRPR